MKKILSLGVAAAVVSLTAVAASAAIAPAFDTDAPVAGETLTVQVVANGMTQEATTFTVNASEGLTLTANEAVTGGIIISFVCFWGAVRYCAFAAKIGRAHV